MMFASSQLMSLSDEEKISFWPSEYVLTTVWLREGASDFQDSDCREYFSQLKRQIADVLFLQHVAKGAIVIMIVGRFNNKP